LLIEKLWVQVPVSGAAQVVEKHLEKFFLRRQFLRFAMFPVLGMPAFWRYPPPPCYLMESLSCGENAK
jgi:hypothetical protein